ncbi:hypothetical protein C8J57DRAFT_1253728 [Mycena rebaudengoi]|nr:hypothetical protein C8J57DRAFT_1253728 [Mycena rebaudengoi]
MASKVGVMWIHMDASWWNAGIQVAKKNWPPAGEIVGPVFVKCGDQLGGPAGGSVPALWRLLSEFTVSTGPYLQDRKKRNEGPPTNRRRFGCRDITFPPHLHNLYKTDTKTHSRLTAVSSRYLPSKFYPRPPCSSRLQTTFFRLDLFFPSQQEIYTQKSKVERRCYYNFFPLASPTDKFAIRTEGPAYNLKDTRNQGKKTSASCLSGPSRRAAPMQKIIKDKDSGPA